MFLFVPGICCEGNFLCGVFHNYNQLDLDCAGQINEVGCQKMECKHDEAIYKNWQFACKPLGGSYGPWDDCKLEASIACYCNTTLCNEASPIQFNSYSVEMSRVVSQS